MNTETLDRPEVADELMDVADISGGRAVVKLNRTEAALRELRADLEGKTYDLTTTAGDKAARAGRLRCVTLRGTLEKRRKELKALAAAQRAQAEQIERERNALIEQQMRALDKAEDRAIPNPQPAAETPAPQQEVGQNLPQPQPGLSTLSPGDAAVEIVGAEAVGAADDAPASNVTDQTDAPQQTTEQAARALLDHIAEAFAGRFPSDPKPGRQWFATLKHLAFNLNETI